MPVMSSFAGSSGINKFVLAILPVPNEFWAVSMRSCLPEINPNPARREKITNSEMKLVTWKYNMLFALLLLALGGLWVRLTVLMHDYRGKWTEKAARQQRRELQLPARPGGIFARTSRSYVPMAISRQKPSCFADPAMIPDASLDEVALAVGNILDINPVDIQRKILDRREHHFIWLQRGISELQARRIYDLDIPAIAVQQEWKREYPLGELAATVSGFRRIDQIAGGGIELSQDNYLAARNGKAVVLTDAARRPIWPVSDESFPPRDGSDVFLCIDAVIQSYLYEALREAFETFSAKWATGVVVDPQSGSVKAMCSVPAFDPKTYSCAGPACLTSRAITVPFEPGSVFKPIIAASAVDTGAVCYEDEIFCENGAYRAHRGGRITDHGKSYGNLTVAEGVVVSSNICMAKVGEKLGNEGIWHAVSRFGFGRKTGIELPAESPGIVRPLGKWDGYSLRRVPFGQEISVTSLQLAMAFSALANGGLLLRPRMIEQIVDANGQVLYRSRRQVVARAISPSTASATLKVLADVVSRGTGKRCRMNDYHAFGKTGTAQVAGVGGYVEDAYVSSFIGGAPVSHPRLICLISVYWPDKSKGYYGATVAAPGVRDVLAKSLTYLNVPADVADDNEDMVRLANARP